MFAKVFLISFAHDVIDVFVFPNEHVKDIFAKNHIYFWVLYVKFNVSLLKCKRDSNFFKILTDSKLVERLDLSDEF